MSSKLSVGAFFAVMIVLAAVIASCSSPPSGEGGEGRELSAPQVLYGTETIDGVDVFFREAGPKDAPQIVLLHGFPTSSHMFRDLIPKLASKYRVIAPDYPGFGESEVPSREHYTLQL